MICKPRLPDEASQKIGEVAISVVSLPVFKVVHEDESGVMLVKGTRQVRDVFRASREKGEGYGKGPQDRRLAFCEGTEP